MITNIILNKESLDALFPEGTEARVALANAAVAAFCKQALSAKNLSEEIQKLTRLKGEIVQEVMAEFGVLMPLFGKPMFYPEFKTQLAIRIREEYRNIQQNEISTAAMEAAKGLAAHMEARIEARANVLFDQAVARVITKVTALRSPHLSEDDEDDEEGG